MTIQQHAPRLEQIRPPVTFPTAMLVAMGVILVAVLALVAAWALLQPTPIINEFTIQDEMLQQLRQSIGGFI